MADKHETKTITGDDVKPVKGILGHPERMDLNADITSGLEDDEDNIPKDTKPINGPAERDPLVADTESDHAKTGGNVSTFTPPEQESKPEPVNTTVEEPKVQTAARRPMPPRAKPVEKTLHNSDVSSAKQNVGDLKVVGDGDLFKLLCKASSEKEGWMKSTKAMQTPMGCVVQVTTQQRNEDGSYAIAEALTFVPGAKIGSDIKNGRKLINR